MKLRLGALVLVGWFAIPAFSALTSPPTVGVSFSPDTIATNQPSTLTISLTNSNSSPLTGASLVDHVDPNIHFLAPATTNCPGSTVSSFGNTLSFSGSVGANSTCTITVLVTSATPGVYEDNPGALFSNGPASLTPAFTFLHVFAPVPAVSTAGLIALALAFAAIGLVTLVKRV